MKFLPYTLAAVLSAFGSEAVPLTRGVYAGRSFDASKLMRNAVPVDRNGVRRLNDNNNNNKNGNNNGWMNYGASGNHSIVFNDCVSLTMKPEDNTMFQEDFVGYAESGQIIAQKSYVIFNLCETEYCNYAAEDNLYMTDLAYFLGSMINYFPYLDELYCKACQENQNYCQNDGDDQAAGENGGRRLTEYMVTECGTCESKGCFAEQQDDATITNEQVVQWVENMLQCVQTGAQWDNQNLYAGFMCNGDGSGAEIAVFLDNKCTVYTSTKSYGSIISENDYYYLGRSSSLVTYSFKNPIDCSPEPTYLPPGTDAAEYAANDQAEGNYINQVCQNLLNKEPRSLNDCNVDGQADEQNNEVEVQSDDAYGWYSYILSQDDVNDAAAVCTLVRKMDGEYTYVYNTTGSQSVYDYAHGNRLSKSHKHMDGSLITLIIIGILIVSIAFVCICQNLVPKRKDARRERLIQGKGIPAGTMA